MRHPKRAVLELLRATTRSRSHRLSQKMELAAKALARESNGAPNRCVRERAADPSADKIFCSWAISIMILR